MHVCSSLCFDLSKIELSTYLPTYNQLSIHMLIPTTMPSTGDIFVCGACSAKFKYRKHLQRHSITRMCLQAIYSTGKLICLSIRLRRETSQVRLLRCRLQTKVSIFMGNGDCICLTPLFPETCCESTSRLAPHAWRQGGRCQRKLSRASQSSPATTAHHSRKLATRSYPA